MKGKSKNFARITGIVDGDSFTVSVKGEEKTICLANVDPLGGEGGRAVASQAEEKNCPEGCYRRNDQMSRWTNVRASPGE